MRESIVLQWKFFGKEQILYIFWIKLQVQEKFNRMCTDTNLIKCDWTLFLFLSHLPMMLAVRIFFLSKKFCTYVACLISLMLEQGLYRPVLIEGGWVGVGDYIKKKKKFTHSHSFVPWNRVYTATTTLLIFFSVVFM